ncbi:MAG TPA: hypothetical protein VHO25_22125 [Polyangiaceae bacterium]|nr:hypothetical protein [Polyangiaceae bacterium]
MIPPTTITAGRVQLVIRHESNDVRVCDLNEHPPMATRIVATTQAECLELARAAKLAADVLRNLGIK